MNFRGANKRIYVNYVLSLWNKALHILENVFIRKQHNVLLGLVHIITGLNILGYTLYISWSFKTIDWVCKTAN